MEKKKKKKLQGPGPPQATMWLRPYMCIILLWNTIYNHSIFLTNKKKYQRTLGMSMQVERASVDQVKQWFEVLKNPGSFTKQALDERILKQQQEEKERKCQRWEKKKKKKEKRKLKWILMLVMICQVSVLVDKKDIYIYIYIFFFLNFWVCVLVVLVQNTLKSQFI